MTNKRMTRAELIKWLGDTIRTETAKPFDDIDYDLVDECGNLLDELMDPAVVLSEEEVSEKAAKVLPGAVIGRKQTTGKLRRFWKIAVAAAVVLCLAVTVMAVPVWRQAILTALNLGVGESTDVDGITCVRNGVEQSYSSIDELLENEKLDFKPPMVDSENLELEKVLHYPETNTAVLCFDDASISYEIWLNNTDIARYNENSQEYTFGNYSTYIITREYSGRHKFFSYTLVNDDIHIIASYSLEIIELLIKSIN